MDSRPNRLCWNHLNQALAGVKFILKDANDNFLKFTQETTTQDGFWKFDGIANSENHATVMESPANGKIDIHGLKSGKYSITEKQAPAGYNKLANNVEANISYDAT